MSRRDVELVIRAKDDASKQADKIAKSLDALDEIQKELANSSGKTGAELEQLANQIGKLSASKKVASAFEKIQQAVDKSNTSLNKQQKEYAENTAQIGAYEKQIASATAVLKRLNSQATGKFGPIDTQLPSKIKLVERSLKLLENGLKRSTTEAERMDGEIRQTKVAITQLDSVAKQASTSINRLSQAEAAATEAAKREAEARAKQATALDKLINKQKATQAAKEAAAARESQIAAAVKKTQADQTAALNNFSNTARKAQQQQDNLVRSQERGASSAHKAGRAQRDLGRGVLDASDNVDKSSRSWGRAIKQLSLLQKESRQSLGLLQRIRGQLLSVSAGYVGVFGAQRAAGSIIQAGMDQEAIEARSLVAFGGDQAKANEEMAFAKQVSEDLALAYRTLAPEYANLAIAARGTELEGEGARKVMIGMAQASRANKLSADQTSRAYKALTQIMSKGKFTAEEVRQQLGDQIPGAFNILADSIGVSTTELDKMMENGQVGLDAMIPFVTELSRRAQDGLPTAMDSASAAMGRFDNSLFDLQVRIAQSGFLDELTKGLNEAAEAMRDPAIQEGAVKLGEALGKLVVAFVKAAEHADTWLFLLKALAYWMGLRFAAGLATDMFSLGEAIAKGLPKLKKFAAFLGLSAAAANGLGLVVAGVITLFAAWKLSQWAYDNFMPFRRLSIFTFSALMTLFDKVMIAWAKVASFFASALQSPFETVASMISSVVSTIIGMVGKLNKVLGNETIAGMMDGLQAYADGLSADLGGEWDKEFAKRRKQIEDEAARREGILMGMMAETFNDPPSKTKSNGRSTTTGGLGTDPLGDAPTWKPSGGTDAAQKAADKLADQVANTIANLKQRLAELMSRDASLTLEQQLEANLAAIKSKYAEIYTDLEKLGRSRQGEEWKVVDALVAQESLLARQKYDEDKVRQATEARRQAEERINLLQQTRRDLLQSADFAREGGDITQYDLLKTKINEVTLSLRQAIDNQIAYWQAASDPEKAQAAIASLEAMKNGLIEVGDASKLTAQDIGEVAGQTASSGFDTFANTIRETGDVLQGLRAGFLQFAQEFIFEIGKMIAKQAILNALQAAGGGSGGSGGFMQAVTAAFANHSGGMAGAGTPRLANPAWFSNATKYHTGGIAGLKPNEVPTILEKGEEVLTRNDPRHALNGGNSGDAKGPMQFNQFIALDPEDLSNSIASTSSFGHNIMSVIRAERRQISTILGGS